MNKYVAIFWRGNPQLSNGGYYTAKPARGKTEDSVYRKLSKDNSVYGSMTLVKLIPIENWKGKNVGEYGTRLTEEEYQEAIEL